MKYANDIDDLLKQLSDPNNCNVLDYIDDAVQAIKELKARAELAETAIAEIQSARDHTRPACVVDDILRAYYKEREE